MNKLALTLSLWGSCMVFFYELLCFASFDPLGKGSASLKALLILSNT